MTLTDLIEGLTEEIRTKGAKTMVALPQTTEATEEILTAAEDLEKTDPETRN